MNIKTEDADTDDEMNAQQVELVTSNIDVKMEGEAAYRYDTDNDEPKPLEVTSDINVESRLDDPILGATKYLQTVLPVIRK